MTPTTPTPGCEPHQPGEREALARALFVAVAEREGMDDVTWDDLDDDARAPIRFYADAALAHLNGLNANRSEVRQSGDQAANLAERRTGDGPCERCGGDASADVATYGVHACPRDTAQIAALTPTRGVSAERVEEAWLSAEPTRSNVPPRDMERLTSFLAALGIEVRDAD